MTARKKKYKVVTAEVRSVNLCLESDPADWLHASDPELSTHAITE